MLLPTFVLITLNCSSRCRPHPNPTPSASPTSSVRWGHRRHPVHQGAQVPGCPARAQRHSALRGQRPGRRVVRLASRRPQPGEQRAPLPGWQQPQVHRCRPAAGRRQLCVRGPERGHRRGAPLHQRLLQHQV